MKRLKQWHQLKKAQSKKSELPETGGEESTNKGILFGGLFSILDLHYYAEIKESQSIINLKLTGLFHKLYEVSLFFKIKSNFPRNNYILNDTMKAF